MIRAFAPILIRGGGDLATGVGLRLYRAGFRVLISELPKPLAVRRMVSFAEAVYAGQVTVEGVPAKLVERNQISATLETGGIPVIIDPEAFILESLQISTVVDARLKKLPPDPLPVEVGLHIGLGPGFHAGKNCQAVIETRRSHTLGRVYWDGGTQPDSGQPEGDQRRVLRAPSDGIFTSRAHIAEHVEGGQVVGEVADEKIKAPFPGVIRGLLHDGLQVTKGLKLGDVDPRDDADICTLVSDKALAIGGGVLEAILSRSEFHISMGFQDEA